MRIKLYEPIPLRWFNCGVLEERDGEEYYFAALRLPSYQWGADIARDAYCWLQLTICWHGRDGLRILWLPAPEQLREC